MVSSPSFYSYLAIIFLCVHLFHVSFIVAQNDGFTVKLFRKTSSKYISNIVQAPIHAHIGQHLMEVYIGTPPIKISSITDTGSDLIWTNCVPCDGCYKQINPLFDPRKSSSYSNVSCDSSECNNLYSHECSLENQCSYNYGYADNSVTQGVLAQEAVTLTSNTNEPVELQNILIGCGHNDTGTFNDHEMGTIGLGRGPMSLLSQIGPLFGGKKFSQCLVPFHTDIKIASKMSFGKGSEVLGEGVVTTPMVTTQDPTSYLVTLKGISVEDTYFPYNIKKGNIMFDSGTPPIYLPNDFFDKVANEVRKRISMEPITDDPSLGTQLCYQTNTNLDGPNLTFHFEDADIVLTPIQTFVPPKDGVFCLAIYNQTEEVGIYGNFAQSNYLIGFDIEKELISFKPTDCTQQ
ncbi:aspartic proteinase CDR1-like [Lathyrus oleraceus]|uniref:aspartic proteinase CDR1-like n=1 Tax=Pisum sativum TaxID=3888 RepID=UPI001FC4E0F4|nr:aspartic proteinase CDR1-like [Pisum sativum]